MTISLAIPHRTNSLNLRGEVRVLNESKMNTWISRGKRFYELHLIPFPFQRVQWLLYFKTVNCCYPGKNLYLIGYNAFYIKSKYQLKVTGALYVREVKEIGDAKEGNLLYESNRWSERSWFSTECARRQGGQCQKGRDQIVDPLPSFTAGGNLGQFLRWFINFWHEMWCPRKICRKSEKSV